MLTAWNREDMGKKLKKNKISEDGKQRSKRTNVILLRSLVSLNIKSFKM